MRPEVTAREVCLDGACRTPASWRVKDCWAECLCLEFHVLACRLLGTVEALWPRPNKTGLQSDFSLWISSFPCWKSWAMCDSEDHLHISLPVGALLSCRVVELVLRSPVEAGLHATILPQLPNDLHQLGRHGPLLDGVGQVVELSSVIL